MTTDTRGADEADSSTEEREARDRLLPIDYKWLSYSFYVFVILWSLFLLREATTWTRFEDYAVPYMALPLLILLCALRIVQVEFDVFERLLDRLRPETDRSFRQAEAEDGVAQAQAKYEEVTESEGLTAEGERKLISAAIWVLTLPIFLYVLGFVVGFPLYVFGFSYYYLRDARYALLVTGVFLVTTYLLFLHLLDAPIYEGLIDLPIPLDALR